jgi:putative addiction module component (TIGR02574 family)
MGIAIQDIDIAALTPVQKMDLADVLYDTAQQELEARSTPLTDAQLREIDRRVAAADAGALTGESWELVYDRLRRSV